MLVKISIGDYNLYLEVANTDKLVVTGSKEN